MISTVHKEDGQLGALRFGRQAPLVVRVALLALSACHDPRAGADAVSVDPGVETDEAASAADVDAPRLFDPSDPFARPSLCDRPAEDAVRDIFCTEPRSAVRSLRELERRLLLNALPESVDDQRAASIEIAPDALIDSAVYLGHSTALSGQVVSPLNPRVILLGKDTFLAFQRGVQQVEVITRDRDAYRLNFYLVNFAQACNDLPDGCSAGDLYTQGVERDWTAVTLRDDEELKNTPQDCRQCHQRGRQESGLLMRERRGPWKHFLGSLSVDMPSQAADDIEALDLARDFLRAKGDEAYGGLPAAFARHTGGLTLQIRLSGEQQVLDFNSERIDAELSALPEGAARRSASWDSAYAAFKRGEQLALPYFESHATDPDKQAALSEAYARYRAQEISAAELPDLGDIFPDDPQTRAEIGLQIEPSATPAEALVQACGSCHNDVLDQTLSRARFNIALARMSRAELNLAIARIELPAKHHAVMPPDGTRKLDAAGKKRLLAYLKSNKRSANDDALLESAARVGMATQPEEFPFF